MFPYSCSPLAVENIARDFTVLVVGQAVEISLPSCEFRIWYVSEERILSKKQIFGMLYMWRLTFQEKSELTNL